jgi:hypothetical protein
MREEREKAKAFPVAFPLYFRSLSWFMTPSLSTSRALVVLDARGDGFACFSVPRAFPFLERGASWSFSLKTDTCVSLKPKDPNNLNLVAKR